MTTPKENGIYPRETSKLHETKGVEIVCPKCGKHTEKIVVDVSRFDWSSILFVGFAAILFPSIARKEFQSRPYAHLYYAGSGCLRYGQFGKKHP